jgi:hypothetical protein
MYSRKLGGSEREGRDCSIYLDRGGDETSVNILDRESKPGILNMKQDS